MKKRLKPWVSNTLLIAIVIEWALALFIWVVDVDNLLQEWLVMASVIQLFIGVKWG